MSDQEEKKKLKYLTFCTYKMYKEGISFKTFASSLVTYLDREECKQMMDFISSYEEHMNPYDIRNKTATLVMDHDIFKLEGKNMLHLMLKYNPTAEVHKFTVDISRSYLTPDPSKLDNIGCRTIFSMHEDLSFISDWANNIC